MATPATGQVVSDYAQALLTVAQAEDVVDRFEDELFRIARTLEANPELRDRLTDPGRHITEKLATVEDLLSGRAHPATIAAVLYVVAAGHARQLEQIADEVVRLAAERRARALAEVRTAVDLDAEQRRRLVDALEEATGRQIELKVIVDPDVVGGVVARVGDTVIDGSVSRRLAELRARLTGA